MHNNMNVNVSGNANTSVKHRGTSDERPVAGILPGFMYFDTTIGKPIWWNGEGWIDAIGNSINSNHEL